MTWSENFIRWQDTRHHRGEPAVNPCPAPDCVLPSGQHDKARHRDAEGNEWPVGHLPPADTPQWVEVSGTNFAAFQQGGQTAPRGSYERDVLDALDTAVRAETGLEAALAGLPSGGDSDHERDALSLARQDVAEAVARLDRARVLIAGSRLGQGR